MRAMLSSHLPMEKVGSFASAFGDTGRKKTKVKHTYAETKRLK